MAIDQAAYRQLHASYKLKQAWGLFILLGGVLSVWFHHDLETCQKHLKALEANGEIDTEHPCYL